MSGCSVIKFYHPHFTIKILQKNLPWFLWAKYNFFLPRLAITMRLNILTFVYSIFNFYFDKYQRAKAF